MKLIITTIIIVVLFSSDFSPQRYDYWKDAPVEGSKIYSIYFINQQTGYAISLKGETFESLDSGNSWSIKYDVSKSNITSDNELQWSAEIYCSIMRTTDAGLTWNAYTKNDQEHFCGIYFMDKNTGYKIANEFLNKVTSIIFNSIRNNQLNALINNPQQCTEYCTNESESWALGWCMKNFKPMDSKK